MFQGLVCRPSVEDTRLVCAPCTAANGSLWSCEHATSSTSYVYRWGTLRSPKVGFMCDRPCEDPRGVERSRQAWGDTPDSAETARYARPVSMSITTRRWLHGEELRGLSKTKPIIYAPDTITFLETHGLRWDDTDRKGEGPKAKRAQLPDAGRDIADYADDAIDLRAAARVNHPNWRAHLREPDTDAGYVFLRRWAQGITFRKPGGAPPRLRLVPDNKGWPKFSKKLLSPNGLVKRNLENALNAIDDWRAGHKWIGEEVPVARHSDSGAYGKILADVVPDDSGWAAHQATYSGACPAKHKADRILAQQHAIERAWDVVLSYARPRTTILAEQIRRLRVGYAYLKSLPTVDVDKIKYTEKVVQKGTPGRKKRLREQREAKAMGGRLLGHTQGLADKASEELAAESDYQQDVILALMEAEQEILDRYSEEEIKACPARDEPITKAHL